MVADAATGNNTAIKTTIIFFTTDPSCQR